jgi:serine/threonine-protein kinase RsbT
VGNEVATAIREEGDIMVARRLGREVASHLNFSITDVTLITTAISEIARNIVTYAGEGEVRLEPIERRGQRGILVTALDHGPGISDVTQAMQDGYSSRDGLGLGLPGARRLMDQFEISSKVGIGTTVVMTKWVR